MTADLTDDEKRRIAAFCETPRHDREPEQLVPKSEYAADIGDPARGDSDAGRLSLGAVVRGVRRLTASND